jgi:N,N-dimethylformamidase
MSRLTRRQAIGTAGAIALLGGAESPADAGDNPGSMVAGPLPRAIGLPGLHAYADAHGVNAGQPLIFRVSSSVPYRMRVVRLGGRVDDPASDETIADIGECPARQQTIRPGSFVVVDRGIPDGVRTIALECWVRLFRPTGGQTFIAQGPRNGGVGIGLAADGSLEAWGPARLAGEKLDARQWHHVVAQWDSRPDPSVATLWIDGREVARASFEATVVVPRAPLLLAAAEVGGAADRFLEGDLAMPAVHDKSLSADEIAARVKARGLQSPDHGGLLACWPFTEEQGSAVADIGPRAAHGRIVNHATWMIGGPSFDAATVERYGDRYDPVLDTNRGHGLRFAGDDLYDCGWEATHTVAIPVTARPGIHAARFDFEFDGEPRVAWTTFIVRKAADRPKAKLLVVCSTNTWLAYSSTAFCVNQPPRRFWSTEGQPLAHPAAPAFSCYRDHHAGQPTYQLGTRMPWPVAAPDVLYSEATTGYSHLTRGERFAHAWLEEQGYGFDCVTDYDLHRDPQLLAGYAALLINGHSEYWSTEAAESLDRYLRSGGNAVVLSGNTMFWRVSFGDDGTVMECRKFDERIGGRKAASIGELYHSQDGKRGSLLRECGAPAWRVIGLECDGWAGVSPNDFGVYHTEAADHFLFQRPERVGLAKGDTFGHAADGGLPRAVGHEWDARVTRLVGLTSEVPFGAELPQEPDGIVTLARGVRSGRHALDYFTELSAAADGTIADMIYWERPQGGKVFHAGAIGAGWALSADPKLQSLLRNVLHHFGIPLPGSSAYDR